jgi:hypothetical protein
MYFITCFSNFESKYLDNYRTFEYFGNYATCRKALNGNWCDMCEAGYYTYAVVEKSEKEFTPTLSKSLGSVGMKKEKDFTKRRNPSGQTVGTVLHWDNF